MNTGAQQVATCTRTSMTRVEPFLNLRHGSARSSARLVRNLLPPAAVHSPSGDTRPHIVAACAECCSWH